MKSTNIEFNTLNFKRTPFDDLGLKQSNILYQQFLQLIDPCIKKCIKILNRKIIF